jgi:exopolysaccharide biosynthesis protein
MTTQLLRTTALFFLFATSGAAQTGWQITSTQREASPDESVEHWTSVAENTETADRATLHFAVFETRAVTLRVIDQPDTPRSDLAEVMVRTKAVAGVNGGYFDPEDAPLGLLVSEGRVLSRLRKAKLLTGVLFATKSKVDIVRASRFSLDDRIQSAVQCGPLLVERAVPVAGLNDNRPARRTFAAVDGEGRAALGICSAVTLAELSRILCLTNLGRKSRIVRALNLDGGSSSAFWFAGKEEAFSIPEIKSVRDFVAVLPR